MKPIISLTLLFFALLMNQACYYDSEEFLFPDIDDTCDTLNVTYAQSVVPILQNNCLTCHSNASSAGLGGNIRLEEYADVKLRADDGKLVGTISHAPGFVTMPQGLPKLDSCTIAIVRIWVQTGALNN